MCLQWRIQDFPKVGAETYYFGIFFLENCMKLKKIGSGDAHVPSLDPLMAGFAFAFEDAGTVTAHTNADVKNAYNPFLHTLALKLVWATVASH